MEETQTNNMSFSDFLSEFSTCIKTQEYKLVNNRPLSLLLRDFPETFFDYLLKILSSKSIKKNVFFLYFMIKR